MSPSFSLPPLPLWVLILILGPAMVRAEKAIPQETIPEAAIAKLEAASLQAQQADTIEPSPARSRPW